METELSEKGLRAGASSTPVAGYVYFPVMLKKKNASLKLEYKVSGETILLALPR